MALLAALLLALAGSYEPQAESAIVIVLDDIAAADLALYGGPVQTPYLAQLAGQGVVFTKAYSAPICAPARRQLLTGHWWAAVSGNSCGPIAPETPQLSEIFVSESIPAASAIFGKWHLGTNQTGGPYQCAPTTQGFSYWVSGVSSNLNNCGSRDYYLWVKDDSATCSGTLTTSYAAQTINNAFRNSWISTSGPRLAILATPLAHAPYHTPPAGLLPQGYPNPVTNRQKYEAMIRAQDTLIAQAIAGVDLNTTMIIVVADNGTPPNVAPDRNKAKSTVFERGVRVPLIIAGPGITPGVYTQLVSIVDLYSTIITGLGGTPPTMSGPYPVVSCNLLPAINTNTPVRSFCFFGKAWGESEGEIAAVSDTNIKLRQLDTNGDKIINIEELYDLNIDPTESINQINNPAYATDLAALRSFISQAVLP